MVAFKNSVMTIGNYADFQAIVLAGGYGTRMVSVTEDLLKTLLPVANIPLFWFPLHVLAKNRITEVLLITNEDCIDAVNGLLKGGMLPELGNLHIEVVAPTTLTEDWGTADVLRHYASHIKQDFILMSGDFVSDIDLSGMIATHYANNAVLTCLLAANACKSTSPGPKDQQSNKDKDLVGICEDSGQIVYMQAEEDLDYGEIDLDPIMFARLKRVKMTSAYTDCHVYLMDFKLLQILIWERDLSCVKADLLPLLLDKQNNQEDVEVLRLFEPSPLQRAAAELQFGLHEPTPDFFRVFGYVTTRDSGALTAKCNTLGAYLEANKTLLDLGADYLAPTAKFEGKRINVIKSQIGATSTIGAENVNIVKSSLGANCSVGINTRVDECILMEGVKIAAGCKLKRCIVGAGANVEAGSQLDNCIVAASHVVDAKTSAKFELLRKEQEMKIEDYYDEE